MAGPSQTAVIPKDTSVPIGVWIGPVIAAWLIPGGGHFLMKRQGRGILIFASVTLMFLFGMFMRGMMFAPESGDILTTLINYGGFLCDMATGALYFAAAMFGYAAPDMAGAVHDYGTKFLVTAGLLNILAMVDVFEIATGEERLMPKINLSHFEAAFLFALFTSVVMGITSKKTDNERLRYGAYCFACFIFFLFGIGWLMRIGHG